MRYLIIIFLLAYNLIFAQAPDEFNHYFTNSSGSFYGQVTINGTYADADDFIAAFDSNDQCVGSSQIIINNNISYINLAIYGDDSTTPLIDEGMDGNEYFILKLYDSSANEILEYTIEDTLVNFEMWSNTNGAPIPAYSDPNMVYNFNSQQLAFNQSISACINDESIILFGGIPQGGQYTGSGVINNIFYPQLAGVGTQTIEYSLNNQSISVEAYVNDLEDIEIISEGPYCEDSESILINFSNNSGVLIGNGIIENTLYPSLVGVGTFQYIYEITDSNNCNQQLNYNFQILPTPQIELVLNNDILSINTLNLTGNLSYQWSSGQSSSSINYDNMDYWAFAYNDYCQSDTLYFSSSSVFDDKIKDIKISYEFNKLNFKNIPSFYSSISIYNINGQLLDSYNNLNSSDFSVTMSNLNGIFLIEFFGNQGLRQTQKHMFKL